MIEHLRKYTGLTIIIFAIAAIAFIFGDYSRSSSQSSGGVPVLKISGRTYDDKEFNSLGKNSYSLLYQMAMRGDMGLLQFVMGLAPGITNTTTEEDIQQKFFIGRMILREAKKEFGIYPGEEEISNYLRTLAAFKGADGKFSAEAFSNFVDKGMGRLGMTEKELRDLASDVLAHQKITAIIGSGLAVDRATVAKDLAMQNQQITGDLARLDLSPFEEKIEPAEEEIKTYWEGISDTFTTEPRRKFTYLLITPAATPEPKDESTPESIADAAASPEAKQAAAKKKEEEKAKRAADAANARRKNQLETDQRVADFLDKLQDQKGSGFEDLAKANQWEIQTTELFTNRTPAKDFALALRSSSRGGKAADEAFRIIETKDPLSKFSQAIPVGENQWIIARLDGEEKSRAKTYPEARAEARAQLISEKAATAMKTAATEAISKMKPLLTSGKSFADAAKEAGLTQLKSFTAITSTYRSDGATEPQSLFKAASSIDPATLAEPIIESERAFILHVAKREVVKEANADTRLDSEVTTATTANESNAFAAWLSARIDTAKVEKLVQR